MAISEVSASAQSTTPLSSGGSVPDRGVITPGDKGGGLCWSDASWPRGVRDKQRGKGK